MAVHGRDYQPRDCVDVGLKFGQANSQDAGVGRVNLDFAGIHTLQLAAVNLNGTESRLKDLVKLESDVRQRADRVDYAGGRVGPDEVGMGGCKWGKCQPEDHQRQRPSRRP